MTNLRALIIEMAIELDHNRQCLLDDRRLTHPLADKARAALAEPEPEGLTDEEIMELLPQKMRDDLAEPEPEGPTDDELNALWNCCGIADEYGHHEGNFFEFARAVLARWGNRSAPQPVPVSERLPEPEDCDAEGRCWWWHPDHPESVYSDGWMLRPRIWGSGRYDTDDCLVHTHWLPANALPLHKEVV